MRVYLQCMIELIDGGLGESAADDPKRCTARLQTQAALPQLDGEGKGLLLRFLYESGLIGGAGTGPSEGIVSLKSVDLRRASLTETDLNGADLSEAALSEAALSGANLSEADLSGTDLSGADLSKANLQGTRLLLSRLNRANLRGAALRDANLHHAYLEEANLSGAFLDEANLSGGQPEWGPT